MKICVLAALLIAGAANAETTTRYSITFQGKPGGQQIVRSTDDGRKFVDFAFSNNGRGPNLHEEIAVDEAGRIVFFQVKGRSEYGSPVAESFSYADGESRWKSSADEGKRSGTLSGFYVPVDSSWEPYAALARALLRQSDMSMPGLPDGKLSATPLKKAVLRSERGEAKVILCAISGVNVVPVFLWLTDDDQRVFFAAVDQGSAVTLEGWEARSEELLRLQEDAERELLKSLADRLAHRYSGPIVIRSVSVFDSDAGLMRGPADVFVYQGRIAAVLPVGSQAREPATVIDGSGRFLIPGLFDMHVHINPWDGPLQLAAGVTTVRDMGNNNRKIEEMQADIDSGLAIGPRIVPTGFIEGASPYANVAMGVVISSVNEGRAAIEWYAQRGRRQIKLYNSIRPEWVAPLAAHAHALGMRVSGHVPAFMRAEEAVRDGYDEIQHINQVMLNFLVKPGDDTRTLARFTLIGESAGGVDLDTPEATAFIKLLVERGTVVDPTLAIQEPQYTQMHGQPNPSYQMIASHVPPALQRYWLTTQMDINAGNVERYRAGYAKESELTRRLHQAGVPLVAGTDDVAGFTLHRELELYVAEVKMSLAETLQIATRNGARYTYLSDRLGSIAVGKVADLVLLDEDPTKDISAVRKPSLVMKEGVVYFPSELYAAIGVKPFQPPPPIKRAAGQATTR